MGFFSKLFGKKENDKNLQHRSEDANVVNIGNDDERMNWGMKKAKLTLHHFEECLKQTKPSQQYFSIKVKIIDGKKVEHIWLNEPSFDSEGNLFGVVGNEPLDVRSVSFQQKIGIDRSLVSDWMILENGRLIGGYTIRAMRDGLEGNALKQFDLSLGGMHIDEGEDYFLPNFETPEGAIVSLENAYTERNLDKAMACKDFKEEARMMLSKFGKEIQREEIIEKTAEALQLSFMSHMQETGLPSFKGYKRAFIAREKISEKHYIITEVTTSPEGSKGIDKLNTYLTDSGWKVLGVAE